MLSDGSVIYDAGYSEKKIYKVESSAWITLYSSGKTTKSNNTKTSMEIMEYTDSLCNKYFKLEE